MAQRCQDPALHHQHAVFDLGLVTRFANPGRQNGDTVVRGHILVGGIGVGLIAVRLAHARAKVVRDDQLRNTAEEREAARVRADPVRQRLRPGRLGIGVVGRAQYRDEDLCLADFTGRRVDHRDGLAGVVDEQLLAGAMVLAHDHIQLALPGAEVIAKPGVLVAVRVGGPVFLPQQEQGHTLVSEFLLNP